MLLPPLADPNLPRGNLKGQVVWKGEIPARRPIDLGDHPDKVACAKEGALIDEDLLINPKSRGVKDVFVWILPEQHPRNTPFPTQLIAAEKESLSTEEVIIDVKCCRFEPHVLAAREGQSLVLKNSSELTHNPSWFSLSNARITPKAMAPKRQDTHNYLRAEPASITVRCSIHPWMKATIRVFDHPYYALTDADGKFEIPGAPGGAFRIYYWHPAHGWLGGEKGIALEIKKGDNNLTAIEMTRKP
jgi:hypothetical protein